MMMGVRETALTRLRNGIMLTTGCRMCGTDNDLTRHHLLKRRSASRVGRNLTVKLCRTCHNRFHRGSSQSRRDAWDDLIPLLTDDERSVREHPNRLPELWERRVIE